jgi:hypothetical protein
MQSSQLTKDRAAAKSLAELEAVARKHGLSKGYAWHVWQAREKKMRRGSK